MLFHIIPLYLIFESRPYSHFIYYIVNAAFKCFKLKITEIKQKRELTFLFRLVFILFPFDKIRAVPSNFGKSYRLIIIYAIDVEGLLSFLESIKMILSFSLSLSSFKMEFTLFCSSSEKNIITLIDFLVLFAFS